MGRSVSYIFYCTAPDEYQTLEELDRFEQEYSRAAIVREEGEGSAASHYHWADIRSIAATCTLAIGRYRTMLAA